MDPRRAALVLANTFLGREPNDSELAWAERVVRSVLPRGECDDPTPRVPTRKGFPAPPPKPPCVKPRERAE